MYGNAFASRKAQLQLQPVICIIACVSTKACKESQSRTSQETGESTQVPLPHQGPSSSHRDGSAPGVGAGKGTDDSCPRSLSHSMVFCAAVEVDQVGACWSRHRGANCCCRLHLGREGVRSQQCSLGFLLHIPSTTDVSDQSSNSGKPQCHVESYPCNIRFRGDKYCATSYSNFLQSTAYHSWIYIYIYMEIYKDGKEAKPWICIESSQICW